MGRTFQRQLVARREDIAIAGAELEAWLDSARVPESASLLARLALEELATNVAVHGGAEGGERTVRVRCVAGEDELTIQVEDDGPPFDPSQAPTPDLAGPLTERRIGGIGLHLLRELSTRFEYRRSADRNSVLLVRAYDR
jgi:serine/threonine-protein kinase RsbW